MLHLLLLLQLLLLVAPLLQLMLLLLLLLLLQLVLLLLVLLRHGRMERCYAPAAEAFFSSSIDALETSSKLRRHSCCWGVGTEGGSESSSCWLGWPPPLLLRTLLLLLLLLNKWIRAAKRGEKASKQKGSRCADWRRRHTDVSAAAAGSSKRNKRNSLLLPLCLTEGETATRPTRPAETPGSL